MRIRRHACRWLCSILVFAGGWVSVSQVVPRYPSVPRSVEVTPSFVFLSDTQIPLWFEKLWLKSDGNERVPGRMLEHIAQDSTIMAVFHLGDFTGLGSVPSYWEDFDERAACLREAHIPIYPAFGNHEYMPFASSGRANLVARFPWMETSWYCRRIGRAAIIILNSNFSHLSDLEVSTQERWYTGTLEQLDQDSSIIVTIVACHHPPFTNSTIVDPSPDVQRDFVPPFLKSRKARLFVAGHAHAFEHFRVSGKDFLVVGGGGGLLHPLLQGNEQRQPDLYPHDNARSFFHYLRCTVDSGAITVSAVRLLADHQDFDTAYTLRIDLTE